MSSSMPSDFLFAPPDPVTLLSEARQLFSQRALAEKLHVTPKTIARWEKRSTQCPLYIEPALREILKSIPRGGIGDRSFKFIDLFAGIGGVRIGFEAVGGKCVFTSEWNPWAQKTYLANFGTEESI